KVYIIDEVHMLTTSAFNALLKTLEEPPSHAVFILATTEPHKIPKTIISRCQRFDFKAISEADMIDRMEFIAKEIGIQYQMEALE
ncbi:AAA family ATPase, partial [Staphylococcus aureus]|nr:AAA family ATPase [Staphylococcus aureus]